MTAPIWDKKWQRACQQHDLLADNLPGMLGTQQLPHSQVHAPPRCVLPAKGAVQRYGLACARARLVKHGSGRRCARGSPALHRAAAVRPRAGLLRTLDMRGWLAS